MGGFVRFSVGLPDRSRCSVATTLESTAIMSHPVQVSKLDLAAEVKGVPAANACRRKVLVLAVLLG